MKPLGKTTFERGHETIKQAMGIGVSEVFSEYPRQAEKTKYPPWTKIPPLEILVIPVACYQEILIDNYNLITICNKKKFKCTCISKKIGKV